MWLAWCEAITWTAGMQIVTCSEITHENTSLLGLLGKAYCMTLVVIVGAYSVCEQSKLKED